MIVNPYAEQQSLADMIRKFKRVDFTTAMASADAAIQSMQAGTTGASGSPPPGWRNRLRRWIMDTFVVSRGIAEAAVTVVIDGAGGGTPAIAPDFTWNNTESDLNIVLDVPAGVTAGDKLMIIGTADAATPGVYTLPAGWTLELEHIANSAYLVIFSKVATGAETGTLEIVAAAVDKVAWYMRAINTEQILAIITSGVSGNVHTIAQTASVTDNTLALYALAFDGSDSTSLDVTPSPPWEQGDFKQSPTHISSGSSGTWGTKEMAVAGGTGAAVVTSTVGDGSASLQLILSSEPAP